MNLRTSLWASVATLALALPALAQSPICTPMAPPWASNNGGTAGGVVMLDATVTTPVLVSSIDVNCSTAVGTAVSLEVYTCPTTWIGNEANPAAWTLVATDVGGAMTAGRELATSFTLTAPWQMSAGTYGVGIRVIGSGQAYTGTGTTPPPGIVVSNNEMTLSGGGACSALFSGSQFAVRNWNGCLHYTPVAGLHPSFSAWPETGPSPLQVQFTDTTFTSDPNGIQNWAWDIDSDGTVDYNVQNPQHTYAAGGTYDVTLDVTDTMHGTRRLTRPGFIVVDPIDASFTATPTLGIAPLAVQFTDTTTGNPTAWLWDFENDGTIDATTQNPLFTYANAGRYTVRLQVTNGANVDTETIVDMITVVGPTNNTNGAEILEYPFNEPRGSSVANAASTTLAPAHGTVMANGGAPNPAWQGDPGRPAFMGNEAGAGCLAQDATTPYEARVDSNWTINLNGSHTIMFWARSNASSGGYAFGVGAGGGSGRCYITSYMSLRSWGNLPANVDSGSDPDVTPGVWAHWAVVIDDAAGTGQWYLNGVADGTGMTFTPNSFTYQPTGTFIVGGYGTTTSLFTRYQDMDDFRVYGRALSATEIMAAMGAENASTGTFGDGCTGPTTTPTIGALGGAPAVGNAGFMIGTDNLEPAVPQVINLGLWASATGLPFDLSTILGPTYTGCFAEVGPDLFGFILGGSTGAAVPVSIPNDPGLAGAHMYAQTIVLGSTGATSPALDINVQN